MKILKLYLFALILGTGLIITGCDDDENPVDPGPGASASGKFTLNGAGYTNQQVNIISGGVVYDSGTDETAVSLYGFFDNDTTVVTILFDGNSTVTDSSSYIQFRKSLSLIYSSLDGITNITSYGNVGSNVSGNFEGILTLASLTDTVSITGNFSARRIE